MIVLFIVLKPFVISDYEKAKSADFLYSLSNNNYDLKYLKTWLSYIVINYWDWTLLVLTTIPVMIIRRKYMLLFGYLVFLLGLIMMVNVSSYGFDLSRYKEQVNFSLMFISGFTFIYSVSLLNPSFFKYIFLL